jgi:O-acetyl-ADP-ribose deacetylase (regulator of RNase III)
MLTLIFFDINNDLIKKYKEIINSKKINLLFVVSDVESLLNKYKFNAIISPANSLGNMNGGIDKVYKKIFPSVEQLVIDKKDKLKMAKSGIGYYIPVGQNIIVAVNHKSCQYVIVAPTMFTPRNIEGTNNIYLAFYGILQKYYDKDIIIACPGLGTGVGGMNQAESATQIMNAINDFCDNNPVK